MTDTIAPATRGPLATEPVAVWLAVLIALINIGLVIADGADWIQTTPEQTTAVGASVSLLTAVIGLIVRNTVYAPATVARLTAGGIADGGGAV